MKKQLTALLLAGALACGGLSLAGCGETGGGSNSLYIAYENSGYGDAWMQEMIRGFQDAHPEAEIRTDADSQLHTKVQRELDDPSEGYDIIFTQGINWASYAAAGKLACLDDVYASTDAEGSTLESRLLPNIVKFGRTLGPDGGEGYYSVPYGLSVMGIVYNVEMFEYYGWKVPETYRELLTLCERIKRDTRSRKWTTKNGDKVTVAPFTYPGQSPDYWRALTYPWSAQYDGIDQFEGFYEYKEKTAFYTEGRRRSLAALEGLNIEGTGSDRNAVEGTMSKDHIASQSDFAIGLAAMIPNGSWVETELMKSVDDMYEIAMMPPIALDEAHAEACFWSNNSNHVLIPASSRSVGLAKEFLKYCFEKESAFKIAELSNSFIPCSYDYTDARANFSAFGKSVVDIWNENYCLVGVSTNPMRTYGIGEDWPGVTEPCALVMEGKSAEEVMATVKSNADRYWSDWVKRTEDLFR